MDWKSTLVGLEDYQIFRFKQIAEMTPAVALYWMEEGTLKTISTTPRW